MARTDDDKSVIGIPQTFVLLAGFLLLARVADIAINFGHAVEPPRAVSWQTTAALEQVPPRDKSTDRPVQELSAESQQELNSMLASCRESKKTLLLQFYAHWSDPCKKMEASSLSNAQVKELIDRNFVPVRVTDKMKEYGKNTRLVCELQKRYRIFAFPTLLVVGYDGEPVATLIGNCSSLTTYRFLSRTVYSLKASHPRDSVRRVGSSDFLSARGVFKVQNGVFQQRIAFFARTFCLCGFGMRKFLALQFRSQQAFPVTLFCTYRIAPGNALPV